MTDSSKLAGVKAHYERYGTLPLWLRLGLSNPTGRALLKSEKPNPEGLTFEEWLCAANPELAEHLPYAATMETLRTPKYRRYTEAWLAGEDPTEWRAVNA